MNKKLLMIAFLLLAVVLMYTGCATAQPDSEKSDFSKESVEISCNDFCLGADISTLISQENSGVVYKDYDGNEKDLCLILSENNFDVVRLRVWNNPYDSEGHGYGGGNCDVENAIKIGKRATEAGMKVFIGFHYSDFWADPSKQMCPKAWKNMTLEEEADALYEYTKESLKKMLDAGVDVYMVQIGNETTTGMAGRTSWSEVSTLMKKGSAAIREISEEYKKDILIAVHFTNPESNSYSSFAKTLKNSNVDYDVFASSYYPFWHGTTSNLYSKLKTIIKDYGKKVLVAEFSYAYTYNDGDGFENTIHRGAWGTYNFSVSTKGQVDAYRNLYNALVPLGNDFLGICYWEPAWIPVPVEEGHKRSEKWEELGSGWATSCSAVYDPKDAGKYFGGTAWDNQALFDFEGNPLESLKLIPQVHHEN